MALTRCVAEITIIHCLEEILIGELQDIARVIHSAGLAVQALSNAKPQSSSSSSSSDGSLESHKKQFKDATQQYFALLSSVDVRVRRELYATEEASIPPPVSIVSGAGAAVPAAATGAFNALDISWLNSRKDTVGKDKEAELWAAARGYVERLRRAATQQQGEQNGEHEEMQVD